MWYFWNRSVFLDVYKLALMGIKKRYFCNKLDDRITLSSDSNILGDYENKGKDMAMV